MNENVHYLIVPESQEQREALSLLRQYLGRSQQLHRQHKELHERQDQEIDELLAPLRAQHRQEHDAFMETVKQEQDDFFRNLGQLLGASQDFSSDDYEVVVNTQYLETLNLALIDVKPNDQEREAGFSLQQALTEALGGQAGSTHH